LKITTARYATKQHKATKQSPFVMTKCTQQRWQRQPEQKHREQEEDKQGDEQNNGRDKRAAGLRGKMAQVAWWLPRARQQRLCLRS
jgi:hypothetical protein